MAFASSRGRGARSEEHTSELQSLRHLVCRLLLEKKNLRRAPSSRAPRAIPAPIPTACPKGPAGTSTPVVLRGSVFPFFFMDRAPTEITSFPLHDPLRT